MIYVIAGGRKLIGRKADVMAIDGQEPTEQATAALTCSFCSNDAVHEPWPAPAIKVQSVAAQLQRREGTPLRHCLRHTAPHGIALMEWVAPAEQVWGAEGAAAQWGAGEPGADGGRAAAGAAHADAGARPPGALFRRRCLLQQRPLCARAGAAAAAAAPDTGRTVPGVLQEVASSQVQLQPYSYGIRAANS